MEAEDRSRAAQRRERLSRKIKGNPGDFGTLYRVNTTSPRVYTPFICFALDKSQAISLYFFAERSFCPSFPDPLLCGSLSSCLSAQSCGSTHAPTRHGVDSILRFNTWVKPLCLDLVFQK